MLHTRNHPTKSKPITYPLASQPTSPICHRFCFDFLLTPEILFCYLRERARYVCTDEQIPHRAELSRCITVNVHTMLARHGLILCQHRDTACTELLEALLYQYRSIWDRIWAKMLDFCGCQFSGVENPQTHNNPGGRS